jgi:hypothetical protein
MRRGKRDALALLLGFALADRGTRRPGCEEHATPMRR